MGCFAYDLANRLDDSLGWIGGRGKHFEHAYVARGVIDPDAVGEGATGVDGDTERLGRVGHRFGENQSTIRRSGTDLTISVAGRTIVNAGIKYGIIALTMTAPRKITVEVPPELLEKAQQAIGAGITETVRTGLTLVAASRTYARLRKLRGRVTFSRTLTELKTDR